MARQKKSELTVGEMFCERFEPHLDGKWWKIRCKLRKTYLLNGDSISFGYRTEEACRNAMLRYPNL